MSETLPFQKRTSVAITGCVTSGQRNILETDESEENNMSKKLIVYFSAEGTTAAVAKEAADTLDIDLFEIKPLHPYTAADIKWTNPLARCNREKFGKKEVPSIGKIEGFKEYDTVYIGFPIWYGCAPNVVNTFCKEYDWTGKTVYAFATSGGSEIGKTAEKLRPFISNGKVIDAKLVHNAEELKKYIG